MRPFRKALFRECINLDNAERKGLFDRNDPEYDLNDLCRYAKEVITELKIQELQWMLRELIEME